MKNKNPKSYSFGFLATLLLFGIAGIVLYCESNFLIPYLASISETETVIWWFGVAALGMFIPLLLIALYLIRREGKPFSKQTWTLRLRFRKMTTYDWIWTAGSILAIGAASFLIMSLVQYWYGETDNQPPFMQFEPLTPGRYWILAIWFPYWIFNIMGEEILWRGVILPRQEESFGKFAWLVNGFGWGLFHIAFGWHLMLTLIPILFILPYVTQKRQNSWIGVILHAVINGPSFIAIALGVL